jgi:hypothetical protein
MSLIHKKPVFFPTVNDDICNLCGYQYPLPHEDYAKYAAELLFHTSRYSWITERFFRKLSGDWGFSLTGYTPTRLSEEQRVVLTRLLAEAPSRESALGIIDIVNRVLQGSENADAPQTIRRSCNAKKFKPFLV